MVVNGRVLGISLTVISVSILSLNLLKKKTLDEANVAASILEDIGNTPTTVSSASKIVDGDISTTVKNGGKVVFKQVSSGGSIDIDESVTSNSSRDTVVTTDSHNVIETNNHTTTTVTATSTTINENCKVDVQKNRSMPKFTKDYSQISKDMKETTAEYNEAMDLLVRQLKTNRDELDSSLRALRSETDLSLRVIRTATTQSLTRINELVDDVDNGMNALSIRLAVVEDSVIKLVNRENGKIGYAYWSFSECPTDYVEAIGGEFNSDNKDLLEKLGITEMIDLRGQFLSVGDGEDLYKFVKDTTAVNGLSVEGTAQLPIVISDDVTSEILAKVYTGITVKDGPIKMRGDKETAPKHYSMRLCVSSKKIILGEDE